MFLKRLFFSVALSVLCLVCAAPAFAGQTPMERVKEGADKLLEILSDPAMTDPAHHDATVDKLRTMAEDYIDFKLTTMYAVGRQWMKMSPQMQSDLTESFIQLLERTYLKRIPAYSGQGIKYDKEVVQGNKAKVFGEIIDKDKKILVEFRLRIVQEQWMIYDVVVEGVSMVGNWRSQFAEILSDGTPEKLLQSIRDRVKQLDEDGDDAADGSQGQVEK